MPVFSLAYSLASLGWCVGCKSFTKPLAWDYSYFDEADRPLSIWRTPAWRLTQGTYAVCKRCGCRFYLLRRKAPSKILGESLRILFLSANPLDTPQLDLEEELRLLEIELGSTRFRDRIALKTGPAARPDDLVRLLRREQPHIVHFSGHGNCQGITLRSDQGRLQVSGKALAEVFRGRGVEMVVLNACFSSAQASELKTVVGTVVGTTAAVADEASRRFTAAFYRTLGDGHTIRDASRDGGDAVALYDLDNVFQAYGDLDRPLVGPAPGDR